MAGKTPSQAASTQPHMDYNSLDSTTSFSQSASIPLITPRRSTPCSALLRCMVLCSALLHTDQFHPQMSAHTRGPCKTMMTSFSQSASIPSSTRAAVRSALVFSVARVFRPALP